MSHNDDHTLLESTERDRYGAYVTFRLGDGELLTISRKGTAVQAVRKACAIMVNRDERARVVCISSPQTIYGDLVGRKPTRVTEDYLAPAPTPPEARLLAAAGCLPLLAPELRRYKKGGSR